MQISDIEISGTHEHGYKIPAWVDGQTQARVVYDGWDGPGRQGEPERIEKVITGSRDLLGTLGSIEQYENLELVSTRLEPLTHP